MISRMWLIPPTNITGNFVRNQQYHHVLPPTPHGATAELHLESEGWRMLKCFSIAFAWYIDCLTGMEIGGQGRWEVSLACGGIWGGRVWGSQRAENADMSHTSVFSGEKCYLHRGAPKWGASGATKKIARNRTESQTGLDRQNVV